MDEALVPVDYSTAGVILDDTLLEILVCPLPKGAVMTCFIDCCHSGTMLDLPYGFLADGNMEEMQLDPDYNFHPLIQAVADFAKAGYEGMVKIHKAGVERRRKRRAWLKRQLGWSIGLSFVVMMTVVVVAVVALDRQLPGGIVERKDTKKLSW